MPRTGRMGASQSAPQPGAQGTLGGKPQGNGKPGKRDMVLGDEIYLWILVAIEVASIAWLRAAFSRYHGG